MRSGSFDPIYKEKSNRQARKTRRPITRVIQVQGCLDFRDGYQDKNPLGYIG